jgi:hypothetical protein
MIRRLLASKLTLIVIWTMIGSIAGYVAYQVYPLHEPGAEVRIIVDLSARDTDTITTTTVFEESQVDIQTISGGPDRYWEAQVPAAVEKLLTDAYGEGWRAYAAWYYTNRNSQNYTFVQVIQALVIGLQEEERGGEKK